MYFYSEYMLKVIHLMLRAAGAPCRFIDFPDWVRFMCKLSPFSSI